MINKILFSFSYFSASNQEIIQTEIKESQTAMIFKIR